MLESLEIMSGGSLTAEQSLFQVEDGGASPTSPHQLKIREGSFSEFSDLLKKYHYKGKNMGGGVSHHLVLEYNYEIYGGATLGKMRHSGKYEDTSVELRRMVLNPKCPPNTASYFLSKIHWWLKRNTEISKVYTFADQSVGHVGTCYKAAGYTFVKETGPTTHVYWKGRRYHPRSLNIDRPYSYKLREAVRSGDAKVKKEKPKLLFQYTFTRTKNVI